MKFLNDSFVLNNQADYISEPSESQTEEKVRKLFLVLNSQADSSDFD